MIGTIDIEIQAHSPQFPLHPVNSIENSPSSIRLRGVPKVIGNWKITAIHFTATYPDNTTKVVDCRLVGGVWVGSFEGCSTTGTVKNGFIVYADGIDENENVVTGYVLGMGDIIIISKDGRIIPQQPIKVLNLLDSKPDTAHYGDCYFDNGTFYIYDGEWKQVSSGVIESKIHQGWAESADEAEWAYGAQNAEHATVADSSERSTYADEANIASWASQADSIDWSNVQNKPFIPTKTSQLENDSGYSKVIESEENEGYASNADNADWADVAQNASYASNSDTASFASWAGNVEWDNVQNKPDIPTVNNPTITIKQGGETKGTFTLNQETPNTIELDGGGGGSDSGCMLEVFQYGGSDSQYITWTNKDGKQCKINPIGVQGQVKLQVARSQTLIEITETQCLSVPVVGNLSINWDGYSSDSKMLLDGCYTDSRPTVIDSSLYKHILINFVECLEENTQITMADGSTKAVKDIEVGDMVLSINPDTNNLEQDEVVFGYGGMLTRYGSKANVWTFQDGTIITTVNPHQFYNVRTGKMEYIDSFQIGDEVRKQDGTTTALVKHDTINKPTKHATIFTARFNNYFANGVLSGNRKSRKWGWYWIEQNNRG